MYSFFSVLKIQKRHFDHFSGQNFGLCLNDQLIRTFEDTQYMKAFYSYMPILKCIITNAFTLGE